MPAGPPPRPLPQRLFKGDDVAPEGVGPLFRDEAETCRGAERPWKRQTQRGRRALPQDLQRPSRDEWAKPQDALEAPRSWSWRRT